MNYVIYTDGSCSVSKQIGGYAAIVQYNGQQIVIHGNKKPTTNNEMELLAVIMALRSITRFTICEDYVIVHSDSAYVVNAINEGWLQKWIRNGWKTKDGKPVKNQKLWSELLAIMNVYADMEVSVKLVKVKGHSDCKLNSYVDKLAVKETEILKSKQLED